MKKAFTLIELLVVVLIIGVLTAIALPKYQVAVQKSRYAGLMPAAKSVKNAEEAMLMARGNYSSKLADLDIHLPGTPDGDSKVTNSEGNSFTVSTDDNQSYVRALTKDEKNAYVMYFDKSARYPKEIHCEALEGDDRAQQVCKSYGTTNTVTGTTSGYTAYVLEGTGTDAGSIGGSSNYEFDCSGGESCFAYDENGRTIATLDDCWDTTDYSTCGSGTYFTYDASGRKISETVCFDTNSDGTCEGRKDSWVYGYDSSGNQSYGLGCDNLAADGTCAGNYTDGWVKPTTLASCTNCDTDTLKNLQEAIMTQGGLSCDGVSGDVCEHAWLGASGCSYHCDITLEGVATCSFDECF